MMEMLGYRGNHGVYPGEAEQNAHMFDHNIWFPESTIVEEWI